MKDEIRAKLGSAWLGLPLSPRMIGTRVAIIVAAILVATSATAAEPKELRDARRKFASIQHPSEADRVRYVTRLVRLRESLTRADHGELNAIDAEIIRHPMPATADSGELSKRLVGRWQSPRRPYFYRADGTWAANDDTPQDTAGTWRIEGNRVFHNYRGPAPDSVEVIILLTDTDLCTVPLRIHTICAGAPFFPGAEISQS